MLPNPPPLPEWVVEVHLVEDIEELRGERLHGFGIFAHRQAKQPAVYSLCYDVAIMMSRTQITLDPEIHRRARRRASDLGVSLAEYVRRLVARDLGGTQIKADPSLLFDLGSSGGSDIAKNKRAMIAAAVASARTPSRRR